MLHTLALWGQVTNNRVGGGGGGYKTAGLRASVVLPLQKMGAEKVLAVLKVGHNRFQGSFNMGA